MRVANNLRVLVRGGGDLASGTILRMARAGWTVLVTELAQPLAVRRLVSFAQAIYDGEAAVEEVTACRVDSPERAANAWVLKKVPVLIDPESDSSHWFQPDVVVDGRMIKHYDVALITDSPFVIGLGPGFNAPMNCHAVIETKRGPFLGRVIWKGCAEKDSGIPEEVKGFQNERVIRAPVSGIVNSFVRIGDFVKQDQPVAEVGGVEVKALFSGILRGLIQSGLYISQGSKIGDLDPRDDSRLCWLVSDKALAVGGGVIEAILCHPEARKKLYHV